MAKNLVNSNDVEVEVTGNNLQLVLSDEVNEKLDALENYVVDSMAGTETNKSPSVNSVKNYVKDEYSTNEIKTNKIWIDNKPIYRKVINDTTSRNSGIYLIPHNISNLNDITNIKLYSWQNSTTMFIGSTSNLDGSDRLTFYYNGENISIRNSWQTIKIVIVIEYTKTTD